MKTKHTPGPWRVRSVGDTSFTLVEWESLNPCENDDHYEQINSHDACLIASSPKLLDMLMVALERLKETSDGTNRDIGLINRISGLINEVTGSEK